MTELEPCPFCRSKVKIHQVSDTLGSIVCEYPKSTCLESGLFTVFDWSLKDKALEQWNRRTK